MCKFDLRRSGIFVVYLEDRENGIYLGWYIYMIES